jgi:tRNA threonylcarbamoyl adenosine modification protein YjeE
MNQDSDLGFTKWEEPEIFDLPDATATQRFGELLGQTLHRGDVVILTGDLGAGKTTLTRGIGNGLNVRGPITSPTFVLARTHPSLTPQGPSLVHVDAYRIDSPEQIDDLDITTDGAIVVIEWGAGLAEHLGDSYLSISLIEPPAGGRQAVVRGVGPRWAGLRLGFQP